MFSAREHFKKRLNSFGDRVSRELDFDFSTVTERIETFDEFENKILKNFKEGKRLFYRGERINSPDRRLVPTMLRNTNELFMDKDLAILHMNSKFLLDYYESLGSFTTVFRNTMGAADENHLYELCAFAQHYYNFSPLIDFSKSLYTSLSFALKDKNIFEDDIVLFVLEIKDEEDYTNNLDTANLWLKDFSIYASYLDEHDIKNAVKEIISNKQLTMSNEFRRHMESLNKRPNPTAKLIDVPTNTRMKFQQGVFLLLTDFQFFNNTYFTKNIREYFSITKYVISKDICAKLKSMIIHDAPWYEYKFLTDIEAAFKKTVIT
ncbi:MAG: FRG domain-containing protein [Acetobacter sp.]|nr:FRG domain-containing protein [Bacteroides sp.]MCM1341438.1 FRG domain-containing protein [Acetobacter sp.]MCM1433390.1 FRG domain-containing protein [Clostridiales bacterium]